MDRTPARWVAPALSEARLARQYAGISARLRDRGRARVLASAAALVTMAVVSLVVVLRSRAPAAPGAALDGTIFEAAAGGERLRMPDGTDLVLEPESRVRLEAPRADLVRLTLERGGLELDVALGARGELGVRVTRGQVRVTRRADGMSVALLGAGESWSAAGPLPSQPPSPAPLEAPEAESEGDAEASSPSKASPSPVPEGAKELLARAEAARAAGRPRDAASALNALRTNYRRDPRAGLAAFELGRVRLELLSDAAGAVEAFADAIALAPSASLREDAEARRVEAFDALGDRTRCIASRAAYLARYPQGIHRASLQRRCGTP